MICIRVLKWIFLRILLERSSLDQIDRAEWDDHSNSHNSVAQNFKFSDICTFCMWLLLTLEQIIFCEGYLAFTLQIIRTYLPQKLHIFSTFWMFHALKFGDYLELFQNLPSALAICVLFAINRSQKLLFSFVMHMLTPPSTESCICVACLDGLRWTCSLLLYYSLWYEHR